MTVNVICLFVKKKIFKQFIIFVVVHLFDWTNNKSSERIRFGNQWTRKWTENVASVLG